MTTLKLLAPVILASTAVMALSFAYMLYLDDLVASLSPAKQFAALWLLVVGLISLAVGVLT